MNLDQALVLVARRDDDHDNADLLPCLNVAIGVGDRIERISAVDDGSELARLHAASKEVDRPETVTVLFGYSDLETVLLPLFFQATKHPPNDSPICCIDRLNPQRRAVVRLTRTAKW
jgi:hypothetical protein